jgi:hypothetical protein
MYRFRNWLLVALLTLAMASLNLAKDEVSAPRVKSLSGPRPAKNVMSVKRGKAPVTFDIQEAKPVDASQSGGALTDDTLKQMLEGLGFDTTESTGSDGHKSYAISETRGTWTFHISVDLSPNKQFIWFTAYLEPVPDKTPPAPLFNLLAKNNDIWPSYFVYDLSSKGLSMFRPLANEGVKPSAMRNGLESLMNDLQNTSDDWDMSKWTAAAAPAPAAK